MPGRIAFQGEPGAYSHQACRQSRPDMEAIPCPTFEEVIEQVRSGKCDLGMLAVENSTYGRVADVHTLLPESGLHIIDEAFVRVHISLLAVKGASIDQIKRVRCMSILHGQARGFIKRHNLATLNWHDNAAAAREVAALNDPAEAALASALAGEIYGLDVLATEIEDQANNTTRFLVMSRSPDQSRRGTGMMMTTFTFRVRNIPAALYKALGGFATNGVNMTKLESYMVGGSFTATEFYADIEGHPEDANVALALEELRYFTSQVNILGVYPADRQR
ncbi:prephenate dehydratase [Paragemmobacter straminiformis]|uniref:prephenate dehydratase n=1 Tax=Paragemmobacter straminiformis TaxID=2045119 RepID=A0A842I3B4_9RHOB|nr:prephenate dehydratase [Gemmobacter straminiformis]MBC2834662.1 prephenate dehydratase [Gemmobacter straminiformis]